MYCCAIKGTPGGKLGGALDEAAVADGNVEIFVVVLLITVVPVDDIAEEVVLDVNDVAFIVALDALDTLSNCELEDWIVSNGPSFTPILEKLSANLLPVNEDCKEVTSVELR